MEPRTTPAIKQRTDWYCMPACGEMAARRYGWNLPQEAIADFIDPTGSVIEEWGAGYEQLARAMRHYGFDAHARRIRSRAQLEKFLARGIPVVAGAYLTRYTDEDDGYLHAYLLLDLVDDALSVRDPLDTRRRHFSYRHFRLSWMQGDDGRCVVVGPPRKS